VKNNKKTIFLAITIVIVGLLITSTLSISAIKTQKTSKDSGLKINKLDSEFHKISKKVDITNLEPRLLSGTFARPEYEYIDDQIHPSFGMYEDGYLASFYDESTGEIVYDCNADSEEGVYFDIGGDYPSISYWGGQRFFGTLRPDSDDSDGAVIYLFEAQNPADVQTYDLVGWDWSDNGWSDIIGISIACDDSKEDWEWGFISMVASTSYGEGVTEGPFITYQTSEDGYATISWYNGVDGCLNTDNIIDHVSYETYSVYDWYNPDGNRWEVLIREDFYNDWDADGSLYEYYDQGSDYQNPAVSAYDGNKIVVFETNEDGDQDIRCFYGTDLATLDEVLIVDTESDEVFPDVQHFEGDSFICTYVRDGNLYAKITENAGQNWGEEFMLNDNDGQVVEEYKTQSLSDNGIFCMWEENGVSDIDLFYGIAIDNDGPTAPIIDGPSEGKVNEMQDFYFSATDPEGDDVYYYVDWGDGTTPEWSGPYNSGEEEKFSYYYTDKMDYNIRVKAKDSYGSESDWTELLFTAPKTKTISFKIFERMPFLLKILGFLNL